MAEAPELWAVAFLSLFFAFSNGLNDSAHLVASVLSSRALSPERALFLAAFFEFVGALLFGTAVARLVGYSLLRDPVFSGLSGTRLGLLCLVAALCGALGWNGIGLWFGYPSSSSHALFGGLLGAFWMHSGWGSFTPEVVLAVLLGLFLAPFLGFALSYFWTRWLEALLEGFAAPLGGPLRRLEIFGMAFLAMSHGANDGQKSMGILALALLFHLGAVPSEGGVPAWVRLGCAAAIAGGVWMGSLRITRAVGFRLYRIRSLHSLCSQGSAGALLACSSLVGLPLSTGHLIASSLAGAGAGTRPRAVRWDLFAGFFRAWAVTIPVSGAIAYGTARFLRYVFI
ncbi:MAG: inorganic phosphate transporter [Elusimicrobia bacterium]|nr:inorganic phosphate transporter [Elusimicrobiota bacterium]